MPLNSTINNIAKSVNSFNFTFVFLNTSGHAYPDAERK